MPLDALIIDVDGTLAETCELNRAAFNQALHDEGLEWTISPAVYAKLPRSAGDAARLSTYLKDFQGGAKISKKLSNAVLSAKQRHFSRMIENGGTALRPGVARLLREAAGARLPVGIATTLERGAFEFLLQSHLGLGALDQFAAIVSAEGNKSSQLDIGAALGACLSALDMEASATTLIAATPAAISAGVELGLSSIAVPGLYGTADSFPGAKLVLSDLGHPAAPFHVIEGDSGGHGWVSLDSLRDWSAIAANRQVA